MKSPKEKLKGQEHSAPGPPETDLTEANASICKFQFLLNNDSLNLSPVRPIPSEKPHLCILCFKYDSLTTLVSFSRAEQQLPRNSNPPAHRAWIKYTSTHAQDSKMRALVPASALYRQGAPTVRSLCYTDRGPVPEFSAPYT